MNAEAKKELQQQVKQADALFGPAMQRPSAHIAAISGAFAVTCIALLTPFVSDTPKMLDAHLQAALIRLAMALPVLLLSSLLILLVRAAVLAFIAFVIGGVLLQSAVYELLLHVYPHAAYDFVAVSALCITMLLIRFVFRQLKWNDTIMAAILHLRETPHAAPTTAETPDGER